jgi:hypothetical protein
MPDTKPAIIIVPDFRLPLLEFAVIKNKLKTPYAAVGPDALA